MATLEITTHVGCPMNCLDCPQKLLLSKYNGKKMMDLDEYKMVIDKLPQEVRIDFSGMCEPFYNPHCTDMILYAYEKQHPIVLYTTLQGATMQDYERLKDIEFETITIHIPDSEQRSKIIITEDYLNLLNIWDCDNYSYHGKSIDERVLPYLRSGKIFITRMHDRAGNLNTQEHFYHPPESKVLCRNSILSLDHNVLLPDGTVLMCCMDYGMTAIFGNLFTQSYKEISNSMTANIIRFKMNRGDCLCKHCADAVEYS